MAPAEPSPPQRSTIRPLGAPLEQLLIFVRGVNQPSQTSWHPPQTCFAMSLTRSRLTRRDAQNTTALYGYLGCRAHDALSRA